MDVERSSLCNCVVNFLLEENYLLTAFELLDDGREDHTIRLKGLLRRLLSIPSRSDLSLQLSPSCGPSLFARGERSSRRKISN
ncbi:hypothetical protein TB1_024878 [Malus domestica]